MPNRATWLVVVVVALVAAGVASLWRSNEPSTPMPELDRTSRALDAPANVIELPTESAASPVIEPPAPATTPTVHVAAPLAEEDENAFKRRTFKDVLDQFDGLPLEKTDWPGFDRQKLTPILMVMAVAAHMDSAGTSTVSLNDGVSRSVFEHDGVKYDCAFFYNGRDYRFMRGDFPLYDEYCEHSLLDPATQASFDEPEPPRGYSYPEQFFARASQFAH